MAANLCFGRFFSYFDAIGWLSLSYRFTVFVILRFSIAASLRWYDFHSSRERCASRAPPSPRVCRVHPAVMPLLPSAVRQVASPSHRWRAPDEIGARRRCRVPPCHLCSRSSSRRALCVVLAARPPLLVLHILRWRGGIAGTPHDSERSRPERHSALS